MLAFCIRQQRLVFKSCDSSIPKNGLRVHHVVEQRIARNIVTESHEPPISSDIPEKPCSLVYVQDESTTLYERSWSGAMSDRLPLECGIHVCRQSLPMNSLEEALAEMRDDLAVMPAVVLMTRGPLVSMVAQYYLESVPLSGLIMVDPIVDLTALPGVEELSNTKLLLEQIEARPLKLEPGVVPTLILSSKSLLQEASKQAAQRHSDPDGPFGDIQFVVLDDINEVPLKLINNWIDDVVL